MFPQYIGVKYIYKMFNNQNIFITCLMIKIYLFFKRVHMIKFGWAKGIVNIANPNIWT